MIYRGKVTAVTSTTATVLVTDLDPVQSFGPLSCVGAVPAVGDIVLVVEVGDNGSSLPDLVVVNPTTKSQLDGKVSKAGDTMSGDLTLSNSKTVKGLRAAAAAGEAVRWDEYSALGNWQDWTPTLTTASGSITATATTNENRYVQIGKTVSGVGHMKITARVGTAAARISLPVTPKSTSTTAKRIGLMQIYASSTAAQYFLEQVNGQTYCQGIMIQSGNAGTSIFSAADANYYLNTVGGDVFLSWNFTYEAA